MRKKQRGEPVSLLEELEALRRDALKRLLLAEYEFSQAEGALERAKRRERMREVSGE